MTSYEDLIRGHLKYDSFKVVTSCTAAAETNKVRTLCVSYVLPSDEEPTKNLCGWFLCLFFVVMYRPGKNNQNLSEKRKGTYVIQKRYVISQTQSTIKKVIRDRYVTWI